MLRLTYPMTIPPGGTVELLPAIHLAAGRLALQITDRLHAGVPIFATDYTADPLDLNQYLVGRAPCTFIFNVIGWSISAAHIVEGDKAVVDLLADLRLSICSTSLGLKKTVRRSYARRYPRSSSSRNICFRTPGCLRDLTDSALIQAESLGANSSRELALLGMPGRSRLTGYYDQLFCRLASKELCRRCCFSYLAYHGVHRRPEYLQGNKRGSKWREKSNIAPL